MTVGQNIPKAGYPGPTGLLPVSFPDLQQFHGVRRFELERSCCFSALLLDEERGRLFVGAKNFLLSLSLDNIAKQEHKVGQSPSKPVETSALWIDIFRYAGVC